MQPKLGTSDLGTFSLGEENTKTKPLVLWVTGVTLVMSQAGFFVWLLLFLRLALVHMLPLSFCSRKLMSQKGRVLRVDEACSADSSYGTPVAALLIHKSLK